MTNAEYEDARDALIPEAETYANQTVNRGEFTSDDEYRDEWNRVFHTRMNELARERVYGRV